MAPRKSRKSGKFHGADSKSTNKCSAEEGCRDPDCSECAIYRQRIIPKKEKEPTTDRIMTSIKKCSEAFTSYMIFPVCIFASFIVMRHSDLVPMEQLCLESIFHGLIDYICNKSLVSSVATMLGGCGNWYFKVTVRDKFLTFVSLSCLQGFAFGMRTLVCSLMFFQLAAYSVSESVSIKLTLVIAISIFLLVFFMSSENTIKRGLEDPILLLLPFAKALSYIMYDDKNCLILESLGLALVWMLAKEYRSHVTGANT